MKWGLRFMGKSKVKMMQDSTSAQCGQLLVDFLNEESEVTATINLISNVSNSLNLPIPKIKGTNKKGKKFIIVRKQLGQLFSELAEETNLYDVRTAHDYIFQYNSCIRPYADILPDGSFKDDTELDHQKVLNYSDMLAYLVVTFLKLENSIRKIHKCIECGDYFISKKAGDHKYCPGKQCKNRYHNLNRYSKPKVTY